MILLLKTMYLNHKNIESSALIKTSFLTGVKISRRESQWFWLVCKNWFPLEKVGIYEPNFNKNLCIIGEWD